MRGKVLFITSSYPVSTNSSSSFILETCQKLAEQFDVIVLTPQNVDTSHQPGSSGITVIKQPITPFGDLGLCQGNGILPNLKRNYLLTLIIPLYVLAQLLSIISIVNKYKVRVIHANWLVPAGFSATLYKVFIRREVRVLCTLRGTDMNSFNDPVSRLIKRFTLSHIDTLSAVSTELAAKAKDLGYRKEIAITPTGVYTDVFVPYEGIKENRHRLLFVGRLVKTKGVEELIKAFKICLDRCPAATLSLVGEGDMKDYLKELTAKFGIDKNVLFLGHVTHELLPKQYQNSNVFVLPSYAEGFPVSLAEAFSSGLVGVTSKLPIFTSIEQDHGFIKTVDISNEHLFGHTLAEALTNDERLVTEGAKAREYAKKHLNRDTTLKSYLSLLNGLAAT